MTEHVLKIRNGIAKCSCGQWESSTQHLTEAQEIRLALEASHERHLRVAKINENPPKAEREE